MFTRFLNLFGIRSAPLKLDLPQYAQTATVSVDPGTTSVPRPVSAPKQAALNPNGEGEGPDKIWISSTDKWMSDSPGTLAVIEVVLWDDRTHPGTMVMLDGEPEEGGLRLGGPWPVVGMADIAMAAAQGNDVRNSLLPFGDTPTGTYQVLDILPARTDEMGIQLFGTERILRLRPVSGDAGRADANGRTSLLLHGGPEGTPTDGSLRVPDAAMRELLAMLPTNPAAMPRRIKVIVRQEPLIVAWTPGGRQFVGRPLSWHGTYVDDSWPYYYGQMYGWNQSVWMDTCIWPDVDCTPVQPAEPDDASGLATIGYLMGQDEPSDTMQQGMAPTLRDAPVQPSQPGSTHGDTYQPVEQAYIPATAIDTTSSWTAGDGAYGR